MDKAQAAREARSLAAEWISNFRVTDDSWKEVYTPADVARVEAALDDLAGRLNAGPSLFFRLTDEQRKALYERPRY